MIIGSVNAGWLDWITGSTITSEAVCQIKVGDITAIFDVGETKTMDGISITLLDITEDADACQIKVGDIIAIIDEDETQIIDGKEVTVLDIVVTTQSTICKDSDGGKDYYKYGEAKGLSDDGLTVVTTKDICISDKYLEEAICTNFADPDGPKNYAGTYSPDGKGILCEFGCKKGACLPACTDADGVDKFVSGTATGWNSDRTQKVTAKDQCIAEDKNGLHQVSLCIACSESNVEGCADRCAVDEAICTNFADPEGVKDQAGFYSPNGAGVTCEIACKDGKCITNLPTTEIAPTTEQTFKQLPHFLIAVGEAAPSSDVTLAANIGLDIAAKGYTGFPAEGISRLFNEVTASQLSDKLVLVLCRGDGILVKGSSITQEHKLFDVDLMSILNWRGVGYYTILSDKVSSLNQLCPAETTSNVAACPSAEETAIQQQKCKDVGLEKETQVDVDVNGCITVTCKVAEETTSNVPLAQKLEPTAPICNACLVNGACLPVSTRANKQYCDIDNKMKDIKDDSTECNNNFECSSNLCINDACVSGSIWNKILSWFSKIF